MLIRLGSWCRLVTAVAVLLACCGVPAAGAAAAARTVPGASAAWGLAQRIPGVDSIENALATEGAAAVTSVSCAAPGDCAAGGYAHDGGSNDGFDEDAWVASEAGGVWQQPVAIALPAGTANSRSGYNVVTSVSCASPGNCAAGGYDGEVVEPTGFVDTYGAFVIDEVNGAWGHPQQVPGTDLLNQGAYARVTSVSCAAPGDCAVTGYLNNSAEFVADESNGSWGQAQLVAGYRGAAGTDPVISCPAPGECTVAGTDSATSGAGVTSVATETGGAWGTAAPLPGFAAAGTVLALSCPAPGECAAGGSTRAGKDQVPFVATEHSGTWSSRELPGYAGLKPLASAGEPSVSAVSCAAPGDCTVGGSYRATTSSFGAFVASESGGSWHAAGKIPGTVPAKPPQHFSLTVPGISCPAAGSCTAVVNDADTSVAYVADEAGGKWAAATPVAAAAGAATVTAVSCPAARACLAAGADRESVTPFANRHRSDDWVVERSAAAATRTTVGLSAATVTYGDEEAATVSATVRATSPAPAGSVTISAGSKALCVIRLVAGQGHCALPATGLAPGRAALTARYGGGSGFAASAARAAPLTIAKAGTSTVFKLSAVQARYGHEQQEQLKVRAAPRYAGAPAAVITVWWRGVTVCVITLHHAVGACALGPEQLRPGAYHLVAKYRGDRAFNGSSDKQTLTITGG